MSSLVVPYVCNPLAMARLPRATFALLLSLLPATATVIGFFVLRQVPTAGELLGIGLASAVWPSSGQNKQGGGDGMVLPMRDVWQDTAESEAMRLLTIATFLLVTTGVQARVDDLVVYGAGSLREAIGQIATEFGQVHGVAVQTQFGPSGRMRERIEKGEHADLFTSADVGHARKLVDEGRASVMAVFVRNTVCLLSPAKFGAATETMIDKLLEPGVRVGMSPPKVDPLGDYTMRLFALIDGLRPGSTGALQARAVVLDTPPGAPPPKSGDTDADAILDGRVDASIVYCSGRDRSARLLPDATLLQSHLS